jgi:rare lipoprotein A
MRAVALLALLLLAACGQQPRYMVGEPYQLGGRWFYPREDFSLETTGLASVLPDRSAGRRTANGETHDPSALMASHRTLQMPAVLRVTNLETGLSVLVRVNDRGPADPGRVVALSRRAAELIGMPAGGVAQVRIAVEDAPSRALAGAAQRPPEPAPALPIATAPRARLQGEPLDPPAGARAVEPASRPVAAAPAAAPAAANPLPPARLPETVTREAPRPGQLLLEAGVFSGEGAARLLAGRLGARVEATGSGRSRQWRVRQGPFATIAEADRALARALSLGAGDSRLLVE